MTTTEKIVDQIIQYMESTKDFVLEQAPEIVKEVAQYGLVAGIVYLSIALLFLVISLICFKISYRLNQNSNPYDDSFVPFLIGGIFCFLVFGIILGLNLSDVIKAYACPRIYVIEWILNRK